MPSTVNKLKTPRKLPKISCILHTTVWQTRHSVANKSIGTWWLRTQTLEPDYRFKSQLCLLLAEYPVTVYNPVFQLSHLKIGIIIRPSS